MELGFWGGPFPLDGQEPHLSLGGSRLALGECVWRAEGFFLKIIPT